MRLAGEVPSQLAIKYILTYIHNNVQLDLHQEYLHDLCSITRTTSIVKNLLHVNVYTRS